MQKLKANPNNPRKVTDERLDMLRKTLAEFGDLGGIIYNRKTKQLVGGHQRSRVLEDGEIEIVTKYAKPTPTGTVAEGFITLPTGERFSYREVSWNETKEKAAALAANQGVGEWDTAQLTAWLRDLDEAGFDMELTLFDEDDISALLDAPEKKSKSKVTPEDGDDDAPKEKKRVTCPECHHKFTPGWS